MPRTKILHVAAPRNDQNRSGQQKRPCNDRGNSFLVRPQRTAQLCTSR